MKKIGLIGGIGWPSTISYYQYICQKANEYFGDRRAPEILIYSMNMQEVEDLQYSEQWESCGKRLIEFAHALVRAGAEILLICSGTTNVPFRQVQDHIDIPILHIFDPPAEEMKKKGLKKALLLGTKVTMEHPFASNRLKEQGVECKIPSLKDRNLLHQIIYEELCKNIVLDSSKQQLLSMIRSQQQKEGIDCIILGCTEIPLLINQADLSIPALDIVELHAKKALELALATQSV